MTRSESRLVILFAATALFGVAAFAAVSRAAHVMRATDAAQQEQRDEAAARRQPTACQVVAARAQRTIDSIGTVPPQLRRNVAPLVNTGCETVRQQIG